ncbi:MAG: sigma 54-interacting transcriptional regulator [Eubacteriaceae bacterium]|nr:sigma 54-interacting transcriptional regulator [Eubacteriaceae bacterium]
MTNKISKARTKKFSEEFSEKFYKIMADNFGEEIFVTDGDGCIMFVNPASVAYIQQPVDEIIGKTAAQLEEEGAFSKSVTMEAVRTGKESNIIQTLRDGRTVLATAVPVYDKNHEKIEMIISTSKDVDEVNKLLHTVEAQKEEINNLRDNVFEELNFISADPAMKELKFTLAKIAPLDMPILVEGETGVGKEIAVRTIHRFSDRREGPLFKINCGTIPENLIESELFGYEKGAFTGAEKTGKKGKLELAEGGTLFLDEIGEMPLGLQVRLLDFLQEGMIVRVGGTKPVKINTRVVAATNRNLKAMMDDGTFRQDLYYRLSVIPVRIPPLRERPDDIEALIKYFVSKYNSKYSGHKKINESFLDAAKGYSWPGNVRELEHTVERAYIMSIDTEMRQEDISILLNNDKADEGASKVFCIDIVPLKEAKHQIEKQLVTRAYKKYGSTYKAAEALHVDQSTVVKILSKYKG